MLLTPCWVLPNLASQKIASQIHMSIRGCSQNPFSSWRPPAHDEGAERPDDKERATPTSVLWPQHCCQALADI